MVWEQDPLASVVESTAGTYNFPNNSKTSCGSPDSHKHLLFPEYQEMPTRDRQKPDQVIRDPQASNLHPWRYTGLASSSDAPIKRTVPESAWQGYAGAELLGYTTAQLQEEANHKRLLEQITRHLEIQPADLKISLWLNPDIRWKNQDL
ncbi:hypothetical protein BTVI_110249 [Pitangus sulphuratus]|nr:hypothetical protein BTVI_110249 [Pitangus sulphuratus]